MVRCNSRGSNGMVCNRVAFTQTTEITKATKMTKTTQAATNNGVEGCPRGNHSRKGFCRNPRGIFPNRVPGEFFAGGIFWWIFSGLFPWKKQEEKSTPKIHGKIQIGIWELRGQNPHCKDPALKITNTTEITETTGIWDANHEFPKQRVLKYPTWGIGDRATTRFQAKQGF